MHSTIHQVHRLTDLISTALENKENCFGLFIGIAQAFNRVWDKGLLYKLKLFMPASYYLIIKPYLQNRTFVVRQDNNISLHTQYMLESHRVVIYYLIYIMYTQQIPFNLVIPILRLMLMTLPFFSPVQILT